jgi:3-oxoacyl-[acyl-carrier-protein] synthase-1
MQPRAVIASVGVRSAIGLSAVETAMMLRAGSAAMAESALVDSTEEIVTFCVQPTLPPTLVGWERLGQLAIPPMREALAPFGKTAAELRMKLVLCVDEIGKREMARAQTGAFGDKVHPAAPMVNYVHERAKELVTSKIPIQLCARGSAGPATIMEDIVSSLERGEHDAILLGGLHTDYDPERIADLQEQGRLYSSENLDALIPGECAAFVVLVAPSLARHWHVPAHAGIVAFGQAWEEATPDNDHPAMEAYGLTSAVKLATKSTIEAGMKIGWSITDMTFEMRAVYEWQAMLVRTRSAWGEPYVVDSPAQRIGNLGAAAMPFAMAMAHEGARRGVAPHRGCLVLAASDGGARGAVLLTC